MEKTPTKFKDLKNKYENEIHEQKLDNHLQKEAEELFQKALRSKDKEKQCSYSLDAYELYPENYQYKTFAISKYPDILEQLVSYKALIEEINNYYKASINGLISFFDINELESVRYQDLLYDYIICLIKNEKNNEAIEEINKFILKYNKYDYKINSLLLNVHLICNNYNEVIKLYNEYSCEDVSLLIPISNAYLKLKQYKNFAIIIKRIQNINQYFEEIISNLEVNKERIEKANKKYLIGTKNEIFYSIKYFYEYYFNDKEFINLVKASNIMHS